MDPTPDMRRVLVLLTQSMDPLNDVVTQAQTLLPGHAVEIVDLTQGEPDYQRVLKAVFDADSVQVW